MEASFWLKLTLSFIVGSLWVTLSTLSAERFGSKVGGMIGGLPSTVVIALYFIGLTQSPQVAALATTVMPLAMGVNGLFMLAFLLLMPYGLWAAVLGALLVWLTGSSMLYLLDLQLFWASILGWLILLATGYLAMEKWMKIASYGKVKITYPPSQLIWRALFGGVVIALAVLMGKLGGPLLGGIFGSFPAMFLSNLVISFNIAGASFTRAVGKSLFISGMVNVPLYEIAVRLLYPKLGLGSGTLVAVLFSLVIGYLTYLMINARMS
jgi:hypothetical protein